MTQIAIYNQNEEIIMIYDSNVIPRKGELINLTHRGTFRIDEIVYRLADDSDLLSGANLLLYIEVIINTRNPITLGEHNEK